MNRRLVFAIPGDLRTMTGGYAYDRRMIAELGALGWSVTHLELPGSFPDPGPSDIEETARLLAEIGDGAAVLVDGLAFSAAPEVFAAQADRLAFVALIHHPLALETGLTRQRQDALRAAETRALELARAVVVTSAMTGRELTDSFGVEPGRITVAVPGTDRQARAPAQGAPPTILSVGTLVPRKGHDVLITALSRVADLDWRCRIVGDATRDLDHASALAQLIGGFGLGDRITLAGGVDDTGAAFARADLFALATHYEGYGMVFAEALAHGLPIVGTRAGAVAEVVPADAGILVEPNDVPAFGGALRTLLADPALRRRYADGAFDAGQRLATWENSARHIDDTLRRLAA
ncbi:glycosyl hydrolase [Aureimonas sp. SA4125]|uniref:glycosyltransferase family 4 protein n=1 Tax=Aureimonas sp. SA4125 TaxID=2826993 RepID=UPI001CC37992|nr:glycosyltransferase family 4 protein [Aureimonas sp. SA4125]BDA86453.1 glycosyl hydrolase [Aureimonas sp. SA4125]